ncbi:hypothetical protein HDU76_001893 [Blyttiomyces sp. JEL0837]|nr:hypothetical protein HDU76_001893 [Blyttiomyces sp. JEL0837]
MSYITVRYGVLLNHVKRVCGFQEITENIDLASETGEVMDLVGKPKEYAKKYLEPRANYILVKVIGEETEESQPTYISLLEQVGEKLKFTLLNPTLRQKLKVKAGARGDAPSRFPGNDDKEGKEGAGGAPTKETKKAAQAQKAAAKAALAAAGGGGSAGNSLDDIHGATGGGGVGGGGGGDKKKGKGGASGAGTGKAPSAAGNAGGAKAKKASK